MNHWRTLCSSCTSCPIQPPLFSIWQSLSLLPTTTTRLDRGKVGESQAVRNDLVMLSSKIELIRFLALPPSPKSRILLFVTVILSFTDFIIQICVSFLLCTRHYALVIHPFQLPAQWRVHCNGSIEV